MPIYEYEREDGTVFEVMQKVSDSPLEKCPETGMAVRRLVSASAFHLKGSGWYKTDYGASSSNGSGSKAASNGSSSSTDSGSKSDSTSGKSESSDSPSSSAPKKGCGSGCGCH